MKILMVCLGNICRSPLAHGIMDNLVEQQGLGWQVDSEVRATGMLGRAPTGGRYAKQSYMVLTLAGKFAGNLAWPILMNLTTLL